MILYATPGGCSLASHIALVELGHTYELVRVDRSKRTSDGRDFLVINPRGATPALQLDDGAVLTESLAILAHLGEGHSPLPAAGLQRSRVLEAVSFMTTEVHGSFRTFFYPDAAPLETERARRKLDAHFTTLADQLGEQPFLLGADLTLADPYLFVMLTWAGNFGVPVPARLTAYLGRMAQRPSVVRALGEQA